MARGGKGKRLFAAFRGDHRPLRLDRREAGHEPGCKRGGHQHHQDAFQKTGIRLNPGHRRLSSKRLAQRQLMLKGPYRMNHDPGLNRGFISRS